jgi:hypothetical protein
MSSRIPSIMYEDIPSSNLDYKFRKAKIGKFNVIIMKDNGYINATKLCTTGGKHFYNWSSTDKSKELVKELEKNLKESKDINAVIVVKGGDNNLRGSYVHPILIVHIAFWMSPKFAIYISYILDRWVNLSKDNEKEYWSAMGECIKYSKNNDENKFSEKDVQMMLNAKYAGSIEVKTPVGYIDILTDTDLIEIKKCKDWKCALGQLLSYGKYYPKHNKVVYLFEYKNTNLEPILELFKQYDIIVRYFD